MTHPATLSPEAKRINSIIKPFFIVLSVLAVINIQKTPVLSQSFTKASNTEKLLIPYSIHKIEEAGYSSKPVEHYLDILAIGIERIEKLKNLSLQEKLEKEGNLSFRIHAAIFLGRANNKKAVRLLQKTLASTVHPSLRVQCIDALARLNDIISVKYIENALLDKDGFVQNSLNKIEQEAKKDPKNRQRFPKPLEYQRVKVIAAWALGHMNRKFSISSLVSALKDKNLEVRANAAFSLGEMAVRDESYEKHPFSVTDHIDVIVNKFNKQDAKVKFRISLAYPMLKRQKNQPKGYFYLAKSLLDPDETIRVLAAKILGKLRDIRGASPLKDALARERDDWVSEEIEVALKRIKIFNQSR